VTFSPTFFSTDNICVLWPTFS